jgi:tetratricopeptide (TPR) repeat protein
MNARVWSLILLCAVFCSACKEKSEVASGPGNSAGALHLAPRDPGLKPFPGPFQTETEHIIGRILTRFAALCYQATGNTNPATCKIELRELSASPAWQPAYQIRITPHGQQKTIEGKIHFTKPVWDPESYEPLFAKIFSAYPIKGTAAAPQSELSIVSRLTDFNARALQEENSRLEKMFRTNFVSAEAHLEAAVLLGAFALRDFAKEFYDVRSELCELTVRIGFATKLGSTPAATRDDPLHQLAEAMLFTGMQNQVEALKRIERLSSAEPMVRWKRALHARVTGDFRSLREVSRTVLEEVMFFHAYCNSVGIPEAWELVPTNRKSRLGDLVAIGYTYGPSVEMGHFFGEVGVPLLGEEIKTVHRNFELKGGETLENLLPEDFTTVRTGETLFPISPGLWSYHLQRQLCHLLYSHFRFLRRSLGMPEEAMSYRSQLGSNFSQLRLFPWMARLMVQSKEEHHAAVDQIVDLWFKEPFFIPPSLRNQMFFNWEKSPLYLPKKLYTDLFGKHGPPPGTAYDPLPVAGIESGSSGAEGQALWNYLFTIAPYDRTVIRFYIENGGRNWNDYATVRKAYEAVLDFSPRAMNEVAKRAATADPTAYVQLLEKASEFDSRGYFQLGHHYANQGKEAKALECYEKGIQESKDEVHLANNVNWLVFYYERNGMPAKAEALADRAAEAYSFSGLGTRADLHEYRREWGKAFEYHQKMAERYGNKEYLVKYVLRYKLSTGNTDRDQILKENEKLIFREGKSSVTLASFNRPPRSGIQFGRSSDHLAAAGLTTNDVVVAIYGFRVENVEQYSYLRDVTPEPSLNLIVWDGSAYKEVVASPPGKKFGSPVITYSPPKRFRKEQ